MTDHAATAWTVSTRTRGSSVSMLVILALVVLAFAIPLFVSRAVIQDLFFILTMLVLAQCWNLLAGYAGLVSVGQQAFVGFGAYAMFAGVSLLGMDPMAAIVLGGLAALVLSVPTAFFVFRLQGAYFAIGTWVIAEIVRPGTGDNVAEGEVGEVVVTTFNEDYPLVRFATGDLSAVLPGPSPCGRTNMRIKGWMGRADQTTKVKGLFVHPHHVAEVLRRHGLARGRLVVENEGGEDRMTLHVEGSLADAAALGRGQRRHLAGRAARHQEVRAEIDLATGQPPHGGLVHRAGGGEGSDESRADAGELGAHVSLQ